MTDTKTAQHTPRYWKGYAEENTMGMELRNAIRLVVNAYETGWLQPSLLARDTKASGGDGLTHAEVIHKALTVLRRATSGEVPGDSTLETREERP